MIMIENGDYSDWQYNRINVIQLSAFLMEAYLMVFSLLEFQIRKSQYNVLSDYQNIILHSILIVSLIKIIVLWLKNKAELDFYKSKLFENWLVCPSLNRDRGRIDLVVNGQLWGLLDYFERYELLQQFGNGSDRPDQRFKSGYDLRIFTKQGGNPLAYYTCLSTPTATLTATLTATSNLKSQDPKSQDPKSPDLKSQNLTPQDITANGPRTSGIDSINNSAPNLLTTTALVPERSSRRCSIHIRDFNNGLGIRSPL